MVKVMLFFNRNLRVQTVMLAIILIISLVSSGQSVYAAEGTSSSEQSTTTIDANNLKDGSYYIDYTVLYADEDKTSMSAQYLVSPALLKVKDNKKTVSFTVLQSKEIVGVKFNGSEGTITNNDTASNTRVVTFDVENLANIQPGWISVHWIMESIDFKYIHTYDIRFKFLTETIKSVADDAPVPTSDGTVGFPSGMNEADNPTGNEGEVQANQETNTIFTDIEGHWAKSAIEQAVQLQIAAGYSDNTFKPNDVISRSQFAVMLSRALKLPEASTSSSFADQKEIPAWAINHINAVVSAGLMGGYNDGTFRGNLNISRTEMAVIIARAAQLDVNNAGSVNFADASNIPTWAQKEVAAAVQSGLINGKSNNRFEPSASATRAEALSILLRLINKSA